MYYTKDAHMCPHKVHWVPIDPENIYKCEAFPQQTVSKDVKPDVYSQPSVLQLPKLV